MAKDTDDFQLANSLLNAAETPHKPFKRFSNPDISTFGIWILNHDSLSSFGVKLDRRQLSKMLKNYGYSDKAVKAILEWYK